MNKDNHVSICHLLQLKFRILDRGFWIGGIAALYQFKTDRIP